MDTTTRNLIAQTLFNIAKDYYDSNGDNLKKSKFQGARKIASFILTKSEINEICAEACFGNDD